MNELKQCTCGGNVEVREYYIKGVANRKNYFVTCTNCIYRTRNRNKRYKAIEEWNEFGAKYFCEERGLNYFE